MTEKIRTGFLSRSFELDTRAINREERSVPVSFSSEEPVLRFFGWEILSHEPGAIKTERINNGLPVLANHDRDRQIGILENPSIGPDRKGRGRVRFSKSPLANEYFQDAIDGIRKGISTGYVIHRMEEIGEKDGEKVFKAVSWEPLEISFASVAADTTVGVNREMDSNETEIIKGDISNMDKVEDLRGEQKERTRVSEIMAIGQKAGLLDAALTWVNEGKTVESFRQHVLDEMGKKLDAHIEVGQDRAEGKPFGNFGEFLWVVRSDRKDPRLRQLSAEAQIGKRALSIGVGSAGGFAVPQQFGAMFMEVPIEEALFRRMANVIPAGTPPDAAMPVPCLDQGTSHGRLAGFEMEWIGEGVEKPKTDLFLREITLEPHELAESPVATDKLLRNWTSSGAIIERMARSAVLSFIELAFVNNGNGVGKPLSVTNSGNSAAITVLRSGGASTIVWQDIYTMFARILRQGGGSPFWVCWSTCLPQLITMKDEGSVLVWQPSARDGVPSTMMGLPVYIYDRLPSLGNRGDLMLLNLNPYYYIKDGSGPYFAASEHVYFTSNRTVFKIFHYVDGQPAVTEAMQLEGDTSQTVSPFVILE